MREEKVTQHGNLAGKSHLQRILALPLQLEFKSGRNDHFMQDYAIKTVQTQEIDTIRSIYKSQRTKGTATVQFPFNISRKNYSRYIIPYVKYEIQAIHSITQRRSYLLDHNRWTSLPSNNPYNSVLTNPDDAKLQIIRYGLVLNNQTRTSQRDIYPRWGQRLEVGYAHRRHSTDWTTATRNGQKDVCIFPDSGNITLGRSTSVIN